MDRRKFIKNSIKGVAVISVTPLIKVEDLQSKYILCVDPYLPNGESNSICILRRSVEYPFRKDECFVAEYKYELFDNGVKIIAKENGK